MKWYYTIDGRREGPVEEQKLFSMARDGRLKPTDFVWNETMGDQWAEASTVEGLFDSKAPVTSPLAEEQAKDASYVIGIISCTAPVGPAWRRMKEILFRPFNFAKWFALGFTAWLASLGQGGGSGGGGGGSGRSSGGDLGKWRDSAGNNLNAVIDQIKAFLKEYSGTIVLIVVIAVVVFVIIGLVILWVRSRGKFMFLDNVVNNRSKISAPWKVFAQHGKSLFLWNVVFSVACLSVSLLLLTLTFFSVIMPCVKARAWVPSVVPGIVFSGILWLVFGIAAGYIARFLEDFVVPIMYKFDLTAMEAWGRFLGLLKPHFWKFILYGLFYLVLSMAAGICILLLIIVTCCIAGCLMAIPYVGAVLLLPVTVFFRVYSIEYLSRFGPEYRLARD